MRNSPQIQRRSYKAKLEKAVATIEFTQKLGVEVDTHTRMYFMALRQLEAARITGTKLTKTVAKRLRWIVSKYEKSNKLEAQGAITL